VAGSIDRRIEALEKLCGSSAEGHSSAERSREELLDKSWGGALDALAHLKRAPVDDEKWRFDVERLRDESPFTTACYVAALAHKEHPDEERGREILEEAVAGRELEGAPLWEMIAGLIDGLNWMREEREEHEKRGA
jgi:hypothetical protein